MNPIIQISIIYFALVSQSSTRRKSYLKYMSHRNVFRKAEINQNEFKMFPRGYSNKGMSKLEAKCRRQTRDLFYGQLLKNCKKISGWKRRVDHLLDDLTRMRKTCTKME